MSSGMREENFDYISIRIYEVIYEIENATSSL